MPENKKLKTKEEKQKKTWTLCYPLEKQNLSSNFNLNLIPHDKIMNIYNDG